MTERIDRAEFMARLVSLAAGTDRTQRRVVAVAGPPASGKSTLAEEAVQRINDARKGTAALLPMDGFHLDDEVLVPRGWRAQKGAPHTFDPCGLAATLARLRRSDEDWVAVPRFDREIEIARAGALLIEPEARVIVVEGNYLLLDDAPWPRLAPYFDISVMIEVPEEERTRRLRDRWLGYGLDEAAIRAKIEENDLPNGRIVAERSRPADWTIEG